MKKGVWVGILMTLSWWGHLFCAIYDWDFGNFVLIISQMVISVFWIFERPKRELGLAFFFAVGGTLLDGFLNHQNLLIFFKNPPGFWMAPIWIFGMWINFTCSAVYAFSWLKGRYFLMGVLGAIAGPVSYFAGIKFDVLLFADPDWMVLLILAGLWSLIFPGYMYVRGPWVRFFS